ncbi:MULTISPECIES: hypothetical protein [Sorangium]|uniref:Uncharacterized protein n=1 Tax=Sorangium cellulosum TaxID=56 RepID=A0A4P2QWY5_SORCE|nr:MULTISPECIES: hypothetical protein [Sorangium]AUX34686.1 uncharacterized protein SOCE836_068620 [Sorangium cellulosum]WCQ93998.1 hypothetical protein NQZ70_06755 [Sorangium sp. Soce836]
MSASKRPPLTGGGLFSAASEFAAFLSDTGLDPNGPVALPARNFLLDEGVSPSRVERYRDKGGVAAHGDIRAWLSAHQTYLAEHVFRPHGGTVPTLIDPADPDECPETFADIDPGSPFLATDPRIHLVRTLEIGTVASLSKQPAEEIRTVAEALVSAPGADRARTRMDDILHEFARHCDLRPAFAAFWEDVSDLFGRTPADDALGWTDTLRDRCGLSHMDPGARRAPISVLIFRYPVADVPRRRGMRATQPLIPPTVLDCDPSPPFCPAPRTSPSGITVDLSGTSGVSRREVLHPFTAFRAAHVFRVGTIRRPVDLNLLHTARGLHLLEVRDLSRRPDYAAGTDGDLIG